MPILWENYSGSDLGPENIDLEFRILFCNVCLILVPRFMEGETCWSRPFIVIWILCVFLGVDIFTVFLLETETMVW